MLVLPLVAFLYAIVVFHGYLSDGITWDDDCVHRFQNTQNAFSNPLEFIKLWNRPLFVILFSIPAQIGKIGIVLFMPLLVVLGAFFMFKTAMFLNFKNPIAIFPLYIFQSFHMPISYNALTEPVASVLLSAIIYFYVNGRVMICVLLTSLLPLIRLELVLLFPLFILFIYIHLDKNFIRLARYCFYLLIPLFIWNIVGYFMVGDYLFLYSRTFGETGFKYYENVSFFHYINKYVFIVGPTVLFMLWSGIYTVIAKWKDTINQEKFIVICFFFIFFIYILFSWKLTLGQPAGFLRHLIVLTPFTALLALKGINSLLFSDKRLFSYYIAFLPLLLLIFFFCSYELHQFTKFKYNEPSYLNLLVMIAWFVVFLLFDVVKSKKVAILNQYFIKFLPIAVCLVVVSQTLYANPPKAHNNQERELMTKVSSWFNDKHIPYNRVVLSNHPYFFWSGNLNRGSSMFMKVNKENINKAPLGSYIIWDFHYCRMQYTKDIDFEGIKKLFSTDKIKFIKEFGNNFVLILEKTSEINLQ